MTLQTKQILKEVLSLSPIERSVMRSLKKSLAVFWVTISILSIWQLASYAKTGLRPSDEEYIKECDLIVEGTIVAVDKTMLFAPPTLAAKFALQPMKVFKGKSLESLPKRLTVYQHVGGCIIGGEITQESRRRAQEIYKKETRGLFFLKKGSNNHYYLHFEDFGFKPASEENIKWLKDLLNGTQESNNQIISTEAVNDLLLTIKSDKDIYEEAEENRLTLEFKNVGRKSIWLLKEMLPGVDLQLRLYKVEGKNKQDVSPLIKIAVMRQILPERDFTEFLAQDIFLKEMSLGDFSGNAVLSKGRYEVLLELNLDPLIFIHLLKETEPRQSKMIPWTGRLVSNAITIEIREKKNTVLPPELSFLSDVQEFQEFRFQMTEAEIKGIAQRNSLVLEGNTQTGFRALNSDGQTLALSMSDGRCSGIQRLRRDPSMQELMKSIPALDDRLALARQVLSETNRIMSAQGGKTAYIPAEITAFNAVYHSDQATEIFKEVYKKSRSAGKFYALIGLYFLQDKAFADLKADFFKNEQEKVYCQYGCKVSENNDIKEVLNTWLEGIPQELWYTKIVMEKHPNINKAHIIWVEKCLKDFQSIKVGVTRREVDNKFPMDGGLQGVSPVRFTHPDCPYFKIDVSFEFKRDKNDQDRAIRSPDDKIIEISKPYIEGPYMD